MSSTFLERLRSAPLLCNGAMGTYLYAKGIFINHCYDELNLSQPDLIRGIHQEYCAAGAQVIETNTFGANSFRLARHGLTDKVHEINLAGAQLAREALRKKGEMPIVAGSIGPVGVRIEPLGKTSLQEAHDSFLEQARALAEGVVEVFVLETFGYLEEIHQAILACRDAAPNIPIVACVTIDEDGNCLDGSTAETFGAKLDEWPAYVVGCNCSVGPVAMLEAIERLREMTDKPLAAQPNAGMPRSIEGRNIYLCSPEYMASYARKFVKAGVQMVGGCCGTTPDHIRSMSSALRTTDIKSTRFAHHKVAVKESAIAPPPLAERSHVGKKIASGEFLSLVEIVPPKMGNYPDATAVFDVDSIGLVNIAHNLNRGLDIGGNPIGQSTGFTLSVGANPGADDLDEEIRRFEFKVEAGAEFVITQPVFD